jgi:hypothetical protein
VFGRQGLVLVNLIPLKLAEKQPHG